MIYIHCYDRRYVCLNMYMRVCVYIYVYIHTCSYTHTHIYTNTHTHTCIYIYTYIYILWIIIYTCIYILNIQGLLTEPDRWALPEAASEAMDVVEKHKRARIVSQRAVRACSWMLVLLKLQLMCICMVVGLAWPRCVSLLNDFHTLYISPLYADRFRDHSDFPSTIRTAYVHLKF